MTKQVLDYKVKELFGATRRLKMIAITMLIDSIADDKAFEVNPCGNIQELEQVELSTYGSFGTNIPCLILNTNSSNINISDLCEPNPIQKLIDEKLARQRWFNDQD